MKRRLNWLSVGASLATIHYGLGFLVGSGEAIYTQGSIGIIYAIASALGIFSLILIAPFYWRYKYPIWVLMGAEYGSTVRHLVASLSGVWMIGIVASQILGGSWALSLLGVNNFISMVFISALILLLSLINIKRLSRLFFYMLLFSSITLLATLTNVGFSWIPTSLSHFGGAIPSLTTNDIVGTVATTVLVTFMGMDFHQFIVRAKDINQSMLGALFGGFILLCLSVLLLAVITGSLSTGLVGPVSNSKQVIPSILMNFGNQFHTSMGYLFIFPVILVSIGSGSGVTRIVSKTVTDLGLPKRIVIDNRLFTVAIAFLIALTGTSIISLIVSFYAIYVASVFLPFLLFYLDVTNRIKVNSVAIKASILGGLVGSIFIFINRFIPNSALAENQATNIMMIGILMSLFGYVLTRNIRKQ